MNHLESANFEIDRIEKFDTPNVDAKQRQVIAHALIAIAEQLEITNSIFGDLRTGIAMIGEGAGYIKKKQEDK